MNSSLTVLLCAACVLVGDAVVAETKQASTERSVAMRDAVKDINSRAKRDEVGKTQDPLTVDEVIAAIRLWDRKSMKVDDKTYAIFQEIASSQKLPPEAQFDFITRCNQCNGYNIEVWWVDLEVDRYRYRIRDRTLRCVASRPDDDRLEINNSK